MAQVQQASKRPRSIHPKRFALIPGDQLGRCNHMTHDCLPKEILYGQSPYSRWSKGTGEPPLAALGPGNRNGSVVKSTISALV